MSGERQHYGLTLGVLTFAATAYALQQTMVVPALPELQRELDASTTWVTWVHDRLPPGVRCPDADPGEARRPVREGAAARLSRWRRSSSAASAAPFAPEIWTLIALPDGVGRRRGRLPAELGIIRDEFPPDRMKVGIGLLSAVFGIGGGLGFVLSGVIVDNTSWRWIFGVGAAAVAIAIVLVRRFVPESPVRSSARIDVRGPCSSRSSS